MEVSDQLHDQARIVKEAIIAYHYSDIRLEGLRKNIKTPIRIAGDPEEN
jgi:hypothetical protein